jgi:hypothetical protein
VTARYEKLENPKKNHTKLKISKKIKSWNLREGTRPLKLGQAEGEKEGKFLK